jgi:hypothetical protein
LSLLFSEAVAKCFLLVIPGSLLFFAIPQKLIPEFKFLEKIFFGSIFWVYLLISSSIICSQLNQSISTFLNGFFIFSLLSMILLLIFVLSREIKRFRILPVNLSIEKLSYLPIIAIIIIIFFIAIYCHTIFQEWDAINYYIPASKSITLSNGFNYQTFTLSFFDTSPLIPLLYSWIGASNLYNLSILPLFLFILTIISIYLISKELFSKNNWLLPIIIFLSLPVTLITLSSRSLYLDISFVLFLLSSLYSALRIIHNRHVSGETRTILPYYLMLSLSLTLMCLSRIEFGIILVPPILVTTLVALQTKHWQALSAFSLGAMIFLREIRNISLAKSLWLNHLQSLIPILITCIFFYLLLKVSFKATPNKKSLRKESIALTFFPAIPLLLFFSKNIASGFLIPQLPLSNRLLLNSISNFARVFNAPDSTSVFSQPSNLLTVWWLLLLPFIIPAIIGAATFLSSFYKKISLDPQLCILVTGFASCVILWLTLGVDMQPRRLYYFAPFGSLFIAFSLYRLRRFYTRSGFVLRASVLASSLFALTLAVIKPKDVNDLTLFYNNYAGLATDFTLVSISALLFAMIFMPYDRLMKICHRRISFNRKVALPILVSIVVLNSVIITSFAYPMALSSLTDINNDKKQFFGGLMYYPDVVDYFNNQVKDNSVTLGYYCHELITFANRSIIDLSDPISGLQIYSRLKNMNESQFFSLVSELKIKYFLIPSTSSPFYDDFSELANKTILGSLFQDNPVFRMVHTFKYANLFVICPSYTTNALSILSVIPWTYSSLNSFSVANDNSAFNISGSTDYQFLSAMFELNSSQKIGDSLILKAKSNDNATLRVQIFSDLTNTSKAFITFQYPIFNETKQRIVDLSSVESSNGFDKSHIEGILVGVFSKDANKLSFEVDDLETLSYDNAE